MKRLIKLKSLFIYTILFVCISSCSDYVEVENKTQRTLSKTDDYGKLLDNYTSLFKGVYSDPVITSDDIFIEDETLQQNLYNAKAMVYTWGEDEFGSKETDTDWENLYKQIYYCNVVIDGVMSSEEGTEEEKKELKAEALVHRAFAYWCLVNMYATQYDSTTADTELGVPLLITSDLYTKLDRKPVQKIYSQIIKDLEEASSSLEQVSDVNTKPSKEAAYAILSRTYLFMGMYQLASENATMALDYNASLIDLNTYADDPSTLPTLVDNPEIMLGKTVRSYELSPLNRLSDELLNLFDQDNDLRYLLFTADGSVFSPSYTGRGYYRYMYDTYGYRAYNVYVGPEVPEVILIKAESEARLGNTNIAISLLNTLRAKRIKTDAYNELTATNAHEALLLVLKERRLELFGRGFRWFDQKRLNKETEFAETVERTFRGTTYTLEPNSNKYQYKIGTDYIELNPELEQNP